MVVNSYILPHNTPTAFAIQGTVFSTPASFLLDTGAAVSLLRHNEWQQAKPVNHPLHPWIGDSLVGVDGTRSLSMGRYTDNIIHLSNIPFTTTLHWINHRRYPGSGLCTDQQMHCGRGKAYPASIRAPIHPPIPTWKTSNHLSTHCLPCGHSQDFSCK